MNDVPDTAFSIHAADMLTQRVIGETASVYGLPIMFVAAGAPAEVTVTGPVRLGALLQKIRLRDRRTAGAGRPFAVGRFIFDPDESALITPDGESVVLTEKESAILLCLADAGGAFVSRRDLLTTVWGYAEGVETHTLETHIYRLRQKLETDPTNPEILVTQEQGYGLNISSSPQVER